MSTYLDPFTAITVANSARQEEMRKIREIRLAREFRMNTRFAREQEVPTRTRHSWLKLPALRRTVRHTSPLAG